MVCFVLSDCFSTLQFPQHQTSQKSVSLKIRKRWGSNLMLSVLYILATDCENVQECLQVV